MIAVVCSAALGKKLHPDRPGWGIEVDEKAAATGDYIHRQRKINRKPDGSTAHPQVVDLPANTLTRSMNPLMAAAAASTACW